RADGLLRIDLTSRRQQRVAAPDASALGRLQSLAWHGGALWAIRQADEKREVVRLQLNGPGTRVTRIETAGPAASDVATFSAGVFHFLADEGDGVRVVRSIIAK